MSAEQLETIGRNKRVMKRRIVMRGVKVTARIGALGLGPNVAIAAIDLSEDGICLAVKSEMKKGDEIEIDLLPTGVSKPIRLHGDVRRCEVGADGVLTVGVCFRRRLPYAEVTKLTQLC